MDAVRQKQSDTLAADTPTADAGAAQSRAEDGLGPTPEATTRVASTPVRDSGSALPVFPTVDRCVGGATRFADAPAWIYDLDNPYLHGPYAPTLNEIHRDSLPVEGELPDDLDGAYFRNGPNPRLAPKNRYHPFDGDGMVHGVYFRDGQASYSNRWVQTEALRSERDSGVSVSPGVMGPFDYRVSPFGIKDTSNTDLLYFDKQLVTLWYNAGNPYALHGGSLDTLGAFEISGRQQRRLSAHSKVDWETGELLFFDYGDEAPYMTYGVANPDGTLRHETAVELPGARLPHDMGFTRNYVVLHDLPFFHDLNVLRRHHLRVLSFHRDMPTRFGIAPRYGPGTDPSARVTDIRWFECEPCYILHVSNCWEDGDWVIMDGCRSVNPMPSAHDDEGELSHMLAYMRLEANNYRWRFNLRTGEVRESDIDDLNTEFNKTNPLFHGVASRYAYHQRIPLLEEGGHTLRFTALVKYDNETGRRWSWDYGPGVFGSEAVFAPRRGALRSDPEDDGYVITLVTDSRNWSSDCLVFDAAAIEHGPLARVRLPQRVPAGFHAIFARGVDLFAGS